MAGGKINVDVGFVVVSEVWIGWGRFRTRLPQAMSGPIVEWTKARFRAENYMVDRFVGDERQKRIMCIYCTIQTRGSFSRFMG
jgi:hypothetical protein